MKELQEVMASIQEHCCSANIFFDEKMAKKQYERYLKKGPPKVTARIIEQLSKYDIKGKSLIDVGGGIGALQWWFLEAKGAQTISIDASSGYLKQAEEHAGINGWESKTRFIFGDYAEAHKQLEAVDFVTLDKMICCYPDYKEIIEISCAKARSHITLSYPIDGPISKLFAWFEGLFTKLKGQNFRPFIHPVSEIRKTFEQQGYARTAHNLVFPWHVETYKKVISDK